MRVQRVTGTLVIVMLIALTTACDIVHTRNKRSIDIDKDICCTFDAQSIDVPYTTTIFESDQSTSPAALVATTDAEWISKISTPTRGTLRIVVKENVGDMRTATINLSGEETLSTSISISQIAAPKERVEHTLLFYFFGTSLNRFFDINIRDASKAVGEGILGEEGRILFARQTSQSEGYIGELCYDPIHHSAIERYIEPFTLDYTEVSNTAIASIMAQMTTEAPAERYGMIIAGHGQGWVTREAINGDDSGELLHYRPNNWTPVPGADITRALGERNIQKDITDLAEIVTLSEIELEYILFDMCFMASIEALYDLRDVADYIIASPCEIMGNGFPYHRTLPHLFVDYGKSSDLVAAAESYYTFYRDEYQGNKCGSVVVVDCSELEPLAEATRTLMSTASTEYDIDTLQYYEGQQVHTFYDFGQYCRVVATDQAALAAFDTQMECAVVGKFTLPTFYSAYGYGNHNIDLEAYSGLTTSAPSKAYPEEWRTTSWYKRVME